MQQGITPMPDVDDFDPNIDPGARSGPMGKRDPSDETTDEDIPLPPDVEERESIEEPGPDPPKIEHPENPPRQIV